MSGLDARLARLSVTEISEILSRRQTVGRQTVEHLLHDPRASVRSLGERYLERVRATEREKARVRRLLGTERELLEAEGRLRGDPVTVVAGVDEAGMAPLAGPVVAAAVVLPDGWIVAELDDSKRVDPETRVALDREIRGVALAVGVGVVSEQVIDRINIYHSRTPGDAARALAAVCAVRPRSSRRPSSAHVPGPSRRDRGRRARAIDRGCVDHRQGRPRSAPRRLSPPLASVRVRHEQGIHDAAARLGPAPARTVADPSPVVPARMGRGGRDGTALPGPLRSVDRGRFRGLAGVRRVRLRRRSRLASRE